MTDPLSIAAGITGILSFGIQVTQSLIDFYSAYKSQDADVAKIVQNIEDLQSAFGCLETAVQQRKSQAYAKDLLPKVDKATKRCNGFIQELQTVCEKLHPDSVTGWKVRLRIARRRVTYPFKESTIRQIREDVGEIRDSLSFALDVLQFQSQSRIEDGISEVKSLVEQRNASQMSRATRAWLMAASSENHRANCAKHHPNTGLWLINGHQFTNWLAERNSFLWLNGFAGCGKSVLCSTAIEHTYSKAKHQNGVAVAFYYFSFTDKSKQDDNDMLRALLLQLSVQSRDGEKELEQLYMSSRASTPSVGVFLQSLRRFLDRFQDSYILLDALDECPRDYEREGVLEVIQAIRDWGLPSVHLLVTSRDQLDIRRSLNPSNDHDLSLKNSGTDQDIANFVSYQLDNDPKLQRWKASHDKIQEKLIQNAQGVFRYVECQLDAFRRAKDRDKFDECLRSMPPDLDSTYERMLCDIDEVYVEDVRRILTVLCSALRPLTVDELVDAHAVELSESPCLDRDRSYEPDELVDICLGLVEIVVTEDDKRQPIPIVRIAHLSVQEYLQSDRIRQQKAEKFAIQTVPANTEMAQICLAYLTESKLSSGILDEIKLREFPFARFSAEHWYHYYERSQEGESKTEKLVARLFRDETNCLVTWVRLYDIQNPLFTRVDFKRSAASPMYYAALMGLGSILKSMLAISTGTEMLSDTVNAQGGDYGNALQAASANGHKELVKMLLDGGAHVNAQGGRYDNALQAASANGHKEVVQLLLDRGADVNARGGLYGNALSAASVDWHKEIIQILLRDANINSQGGLYGNVLQVASANGDKEVVQMILSRGANVNEGALQAAAMAALVNGRKELAQMLRDRRASFDAE